MRPFYQTDYGQLYCGDSFDILQDLPDGSAGLVVTDPPYNLMTKSASQGKYKLNPWPDLINSTHFFYRWQKEVFRILQGKGAMWQFCNWRTAPAIIKSINDCGHDVTSQLIWDKGLLGTGPKKALRPGYEVVMLVALDDFIIEDRSLKDIVKVQWQTNKPHGHPAEKPEALIKWLIEKSGKRFPVLDPFSGSGTTAAVCEKMKIPWIAIEMNPQYCEIAVERLKNVKATQHANANVKVSKSA